MMEAWCVVCKIDVFAVPLPWAPERAWDRQTSGWLLASGRMEAMGRDGGVVGCARRKREGVAEAKRRLLAIMPANLADLVNPLLLVQSSTTSGTPA